MDAIGGWDWFHKRFSPFPLGRPPETTGTGAIIETFRGVERVMLAKKTVRAPAHPLRYNSIEADILA